MDNDDLLMDAPKIIKIPHIAYYTNDEKEKYDKWIDGSIDRYVILKFPNEKGSFFIQILVLPKNKSSEGLAVERGAVERLLANNFLLEGKVINTTKIEVITPEKSDFSIFILCFKVDSPVDRTFGFVMPQDSLKPPAQEFVNQNSFP